MDFPVWLRNLHLGRGILDRVKEVKYLMDCSQSNVNKFSLWKSNKKSNKIMGFEESSSDSPEPDPIVSPAVSSATQKSQDNTEKTKIVIFVS